MTQMYQIKAGTTDVSVVIRIIDATDGTPETGVVYNTSGIDLEYRREGAASVDITEADLTTPALTDSHEDGGFLHIGNGYYRLDLPDAACAAGVTGVLVHGTVTGMVVIGCYIQLVAYDPFDTVRLGLTALPNAAADAAGGLPISDAGGLDLDTQLGTDIDTLITNLAAVLVDTGTTLQAELDAIQAAVITNAAGADIAADIIAVKAETASIVADTNELQTDDVPGLIAALNNLSAAQVNTEVSDVLKTDTISELAQAAPPATPTFEEAVMLLYMALRNKVDITSSYKEIHNDAGTVVAKKALTDDGTTYSEAEMESGP